MSGGNGYEREQKPEYKMLVPEAIPSNPGASCAMIVAGRGGEPSECALRSRCKTTSLLADDGGTPATATFRSVLHRTGGTRSGRYRASRKYRESPGRTCSGLFLHTSEPPAVQVRVRNAAIMETIQTVLIIRLLLPLFVRPGTLCACRNMRKVCFRQDRKTLPHRRPICAAFPQRLEAARPDPGKPRGRIPERRADPVGRAVSGRTHRGSGSRSRAGQGVRKCVSNISG